MITQGGLILQQVTARLFYIVIVNQGFIPILLFGFIPLGAFVEPDDKDMEKLPKLNNVRIYATGPIANFIVFPVLFRVVCI